ncbi:nicotinamide mononucleotide adenylyltransferase [Oratosquilla oratoria]|uniref:nicotinamide mononucleotide adenylyltransferase n=1 Tax=Oratosquilla oratoria TaxID=337810 RepID=UPI003F776358
MTGSQRVVLLGCGSFNPPTNMHLRMFEIARDFLHRTTNFNVVAGLMSPVHDKYGKEGLLNATERIQMVKLALGNKNWIHVSDWEAHQSGWIPTREVLQHHQNLIKSTLKQVAPRVSMDRIQARDTIDTMVNGNVDPIVKRQRLDGNDWLGKLAASTEPVQLKLLCGADLLESFGKPGLWKDEDIEAIVGKFGLVVITREGSNPYKFIYESDVLTKYQRNIHIVTEWITNEVSSTKIRRALKRGESVRYLVQDAVIDFIYNHALYNTHNNKYVCPSVMLTPSPNPDTDVLLPPPNTFMQTQSAPNSLDIKISQQYTRSTSNQSFSDMEDEGVCTPEEVIMSGVKAYPGIAVPVSRMSSADSRMSSTECLPQNSKASRSNCLF